MKKLKFAIFGNEYQTKKSTAAQKLLSRLSERKAEVYIDRTFYEFLTEGQKLSVTATGVFDGTLDELDVKMDFVISLGGDGTLLRAASRIGACGVPVMGINTGRLGYLADILPTEIDSAIAMLFDDNFVMEEHALIKAVPMGEDGRELRLSGCPVALNDIAVLKQDNASMISIATRINGEVLTTYQADGLIVSTPTGSTAYSLSNGGPVIMPHTDVLCLTPVAPHSLNVRPVVIPSDAVVTLEIASRSHKYLVAVDGRSEKLPENVRLTIHRANYNVRIIKRRRHNYLSTLREKMMWGADIRS